MILADLTERNIQKCVKLGITAEFGTASITDGKGHYNHDDCNEVTTKTDGLLPLPCLITLISRAYKVIITSTKEVMCPP